MRKSSSAAIDAAVAYDNLFDLSSRALMSRFSLRADEVRRARIRATLEWPRERLAEAYRRRDIRRLRKRVVSHEVLHPAIHRRLFLEGESLRPTALIYRISHVTAYAYLKDIAELATLLGMTRTKVVASVESDARKGEANAPRGPQARK